MNLASGVESSLFVYWNCFAVHQIPAPVFYKSGAGASEKSQDQAQG